MSPRAAAWTAQTARAGSRLLALALALGIAAGCTGTGIRQFAHESYQPATGPAEVARVFEAPRDAVWGRFVAVLRARDARFDVREDPQARAVALVPWSGPAEAAAAVELGHIRYVVTETTRTYRSWSPLDFRCNGCVVRNGTVIDQKTELLEERLVVLAPASYRIEARVVARAEEVRSGTRLVLSLDLEAEPLEPPGLKPVSTGSWERALLDAVSEALAAGPPQPGVELR